MNLIAMIPTGVTELTVNGLYQWDYGRQLEIHADDLPAMVEVHFSCPGMQDAIVRVGSAVNGVVTVTIPDICLEQALPITAWVYAIGTTSGQTIKTITLPVQARTRPQTTESFNTEDPYTYTDVLAAMNEAVEQLRDGDTKVKSAEQADEVLCYPISSISDLDTVSSTYGTCGINFEKAVTVGGVEIPKYSKGMLSGQKQDASLTVVDPKGNTYVAYKSTDGWIAAQKLKPVPDMAASLQCVAIHNIEALNDAIEDYGTCAVNFETAVTVGSLVVPRYAKGTLSGQKQDATLMVVDPAGNIYVSYRNNGTWQGGQTIKQVPDEATRANTALQLERDGAIFGRRLIKKFVARDASAKLPTDLGSSIKIDLGTEEIDGFFVVEIAEYNDKNDLITKFRTIPFYAAKDYYTHVVSAYSDAVEHLDFRMDTEKLVNGETKTELTVRYYSTTSSLKTLYVSAIYKEISDATFN